MVAGDSPREGARPVSRGSGRRPAVQRSGGRSSCGHRASTEGRRFGAIVLGPLVLTAALTSCAQPPPRPEPPRRIFLLSVDTLRADHLGFHGYARDTSPYLDRLASRGTVFEKAIAQWPKTGASMASLFTGLYPQTTGLTHKAAIDLPGKHQTLPRLLSERGYRTGAVVANAVLSTELGWARGFDEYVETWKLESEPLEDLLDWQRAMNAEKVTAEALALLERNASAEKLFVWIHYMDPHAPYVLPEGTSNPFLDDGQGSGRGPIGKWFPQDWLLDGQTDLDFYEAQYDANIRVVDRSVERILGEAERLGLLEDALVVLLADHGESLGDHNYQGHGRRPFNDGLHVPLVFVYPGKIVAGRRVARPVELLDVFPTLRELIGEEAGELEGDSLLPAMTDDPEGGQPEAGPSYAFAAAGAGTRPWKHFRTVQDERWKLIHHREVPEFEQPLVWLLYDLESDPGEKESVFDRYPEEADRLRSELARWTAARREGPQATAEGEGQSEETLEALRALGYIN